jgi:hypothetical protein
MIWTRLSILSRNSSTEANRAAGEFSFKHWAKSAFTFACLKSSVGASEAQGNGRDNSVMIGRWLAIGGRMAGRTSQHMIGSSGELHLHTLSSLVQLPVAVWYVGRPLWRARSISFLYRMSRRGVMKSVGSNNLSFVSSSQSR